MKCLSRNRQQIYYALYLGETRTRDANGNLTGERPVLYSDPVGVYMNLSAARGTAGLEQFGSGTDYSHTLVSDDLSCPIDENSVLWIGRTPENDTPHNFVVVRVAKSLNSVVYAVKEVKVAKTVTAGTRPIVGTGKVGSANCA